MKSFRYSILSSCLVACIAAAGWAATLSGQVKDPSGSPLANVQVVIPALQTGAKTNSSGNYKLKNVPSGNYAVEFRPLDYSRVTENADLTKGDATLNISVTGSPLTLTPITISAKPQPSSTLTTPASVSVVEGRQLDRKKGQSVMAAIQDEPGVSMTMEGPTVMKPSIRGSNAQEIVVVEDGVRSESLQWGNEHAPEIDAMGVDRIEVLRGPNSLMYGSDALGGVISITHPELPNAKLGDGALSGKAVADVNSVNDSLGQGLMLAGARGDWGWRTNISQRQAGNYHNPLEGAVPNTGEHEVNGDASIGVRKDWGNLAFDYGRFTKRVELQNVDPPGFPSVRLDDVEYQVLNHDKASVHANIITEPARFELITGYDRVNRSEFDSPAPAGAPDNPPVLHWIQTNFSEDIKIHHAPIGPLQGTLGFSGLHRTEQSLGTSQLTPGYNETGLGEYLFEELSLGRFNLSAGLRADQDHYNIQRDADVGADTIPTPVRKQSLNYTAITGALGGVYHVTEPLAVAVNVGRAYRNPVPFELFAFGEHEGEHVFSIGNPNLQPETALDTDASLRWSSPRLKAEVGAFRNYIHN
jgi:iron complex outermembrane receptor protein